MTPERWAQIEELFHRAADCDPAVRSALLDNACSDDPTLRREVDALLACDGKAVVAVEASVRTELQNLIFPLTGKMVSHYQILNGLGGGGMGLVYRAQDVRLSRRVALKVLPEDSAKDPDALRRFEREARSVSALEHPSICPIYEFGEHEGQSFIVMQLLEGQTVEQFIRAQGAPTGSQQIQKLLDLASQVLKGLEAAHEHGIIHRDIKPGNIFVTTDGQAKILDFGVAKLTHAEIEEDHDRNHKKAETATPAKNVDLTLSRTGAVLGTAAYMSPEQVRGERVDARTDIFSFGLVIYELATGKRAFGGNTWPVLQEAVLTVTPKPVRGLNPEIPVRLESIINKALEKNRATRYQTASALRADLEELQRQLAPKHLPRAWVVGLGVAAAIALATILFVLNRPPKTVAVAPEIRLRQLTINSSENPVTGGAISPDGKYLAYTDSRGLHIKLMDTGETHLVPQSEAIKGQSMKWEVGAWFPDSTRLLLNLRSAEQNFEMSSVNTSIWVASVLGGAPTELRDLAVACAVSPDGSTISFATNIGKLGEREIWFMGPNGEQARKYFEAKKDAGVDCLGWSPDGKYYVYVSNDETGARGLSQTVEGGPPVTLFGYSELNKINDFVWLHDGRLVYSIAEPESQGNACSYWTMRLDLATGKHIEEPRRLTNWPNFCVSSGSITNNDKRLAFVAWSGFYTTYVADLEAGGKRLRNIRHFTLEDSDDQALGWTPDGRLIVAQNRGTSWRVYKQSLDSDTQERIAESAAGDWLLQGATSADGKWYIANDWPVGESVEHPSIPFPILRIPLAGGAPETILQLSRRANVSCARPPSNTCVIAQQSEDRKQLIVALFDPMKGSGSELTRFDFDRELDVLEVPTCVISPDGTRLAIRRGPESPIEIHSLHGQLIHKIPSQSVGKLFVFSWSADQKGLFVRRTAPGGNELLHLDFQGNVTSLRKCVDAQACSGYPSPDGRRLAIIDRNQSNNMWMMENF